MPELLKPSPIACAVEPSPPRLKMSSESIERPRRKRDRDAIADTQRTFGASLFDRQPGVSPGPRQIGRRQSSCPAKMIVVPPAILLDAVHQMFAWTQPRRSLPPVCHRRAGDREARACGQRSLQGLRASHGAAGGLLRRMCVGRRDRLLVRRGNLREGLEQQGGERASRRNYGWPGCSCSGLLQGAAFMPPSMSAMPEMWAESGDVRLDRREDGPRGSGGTKSLRHDTRRTYYSGGMFEAYLPMVTSKQARWPSLSLLNPLP